MSKKLRVSSVCNRSLANACHVAKSNRSSRIMSLWGLGRSPSKTGIAHCVSSYHPVQYHLEPREQLTWRRSSKSLAASLFIAEAFLWNLLIVPHPNIGTLRYLDNCFSVWGGSQRTKLPPVEFLHNSPSCSM